MAAHPQTLVIGIGNPLRGDDGVGPWVARAVAAQGIANVQTLSTQQLLPELAALLLNVARVVFVDARLTDVPTAAVTVEPLSPEQDGPRLTHHFTPRRLLGLTAALWGKVPAAWLLAVAITRTEVGEGLSAAARANAAAALRLLADLL